MGTRADFYTGRGLTAKWLGSIAWEGGPAILEEEPVRLGWGTTVEEWERRVEVYVAAQESGTKPSDGWPWPWPDSRTTDFAYAFDEGRIWISIFGRRWIMWQDWAKLSEEDHEVLANEDKAAIFPDMQSVQQVTLGPRSGVLVYKV